jgi:hypothetical protein
VHSASQDVTVSVVTTDYSVRQGILRIPSLLANALYKVIFITNNYTSKKNYYGVLLYLLTSAVVANI